MIRASDRDDEAKVAPPVRPHSRLSGAASANGLVGAKDVGCDLDQVDEQVGTFVTSRRPMSSSLSVMFCAAPFRSSRKTGAPSGRLAPPHKTRVLTHRSLSACAVRREAS